MAKKAKALLAQAGKIKRNRAETDKDKETSLKVPLPTKAVLQAGSEPKELESGAKAVEKTGVDGKGKERAVGNEEKEKGKSTKVEKKADVEQDGKKPGEETTNPSENVTPAVATDDATSILDAPTTTTDKKGATKEKVNPTINEGKAEPTDEGDVATPRRATKELPASPVKSLKEKHVPTLGLTVPKSPKKGTVPLSDTTATGLSPLQRALESAEDETLMERVARLDIADPTYQPPKDPVPPAHTDLESEFDCVTAPSGPSTPRSRAGRGSFSLMLPTGVPLPDDDDLFVDCDSSNVSVSNFDGV